MASPYRAALVTVSDSVAQGTRQDVSGAVVARLLQEAGWTVRSTEVLPDDFTLLRERLSALTSDVDVDAVFTTGGTGVGPRDRTPEATTAVMERSLPGLAELMRREGVKKTPLAALSRAVVGVKGKTVLVNLPGAPEGAEDSLRAVLPLLPHVVGLLRGEAVHSPAAAPPAAPAEPAAESPAEAAEPSVSGTELPADAAPAAEEPLGNNEPV